MWCDTAAVFTNELTKRSVELAEAFARRPDSILRVAGKGL
jgi:hypothetical protein